MTLGDSQAQRLILTTPFTKGEMEMSFGRRKDYEFGMHMIDSVIFITILG